MFNTAKATFTWAAACTLAICVAPCAHGSADILKTAKDLASADYSGYEYGSTGDKRIDCVQFVAAVVEEAAEEAARSGKFTAGVKKTIKIELDSRAKANLQSLVERNDERTKGVQKALIDAGLGEKVEPADAKPGDLVQYWYKDGGVWYGHAGVVEKVEDGKATIYGAHKTTLQRERTVRAADRKGGIGSGPVFDLTDASRKVYVVRWKSS